MGTVMITLLRKSVKETSVNIVQYLVKLWQKLGCRTFPCMDFDIPWTFTRRRVWQLVETILLLLLFCRHIFYLFICFILL